MIRKLEDFFPEDEDDIKMLIGTKPWKVVEAYIEEEYDMESTLLVGENELLSIKINALIAYDYEMHKAAVTGLQEVQGHEFGLNEVVQICDAAFIPMTKRDVG
jgi:hypothetical protein